MLASGKFYIIFYEQEVPMDVDAKYNLSEFLISGLSLYKVEEKESHPRNPGLE